MNLGSDIRFYLTMARRRLGYFLAPLVVVAAIGSIIVMSLPAIFTSSAKILVESQQIPDTFVKSTVTAIAAERLISIQQRVLTRDNMLTIVDKFGLFKDRPVLSRTEVYELMKERITFEMLDLSGPASIRRRDAPMTVAFMVGFDYEQPNVAAAVANELVSIVLNEDIQDRTDRASETTDFLTKESQRLAQELQDIDAKIEDFKLKNSSTLPEKLTFNMAQLDKQQRLVSEMDRDIRAAEENRRLLNFEANVRKTQTDVASGGKDQTPEQTLAALKAQYDKMLAVYSENHPEMRTLRRQIAAQEAVVKAASEQVKNANVEAATAPADASLDTRLIFEKIAAIDGNLALLRKQRDDMVKNNSEIEAIVLRTPQVGAELQAMERRRDALQNSSDEMASKLSQAKLGERLELGQQAERFQVIEAPIVPQEPTRPKRVPLLLLVLGASVGSGIAFAFGAEFIDGTIKRSVDLSRKLNHRVLAVVPYIKTREEKKRRPLLAVAVLIFLLLLLAASLAALHFFYMPLDVLYHVMIAKLSRVF